MAETAKKPRRRKKPATPSKLEEDEEALSPAGNVRGQTKAMFDKLLQQALEESEGKKSAGKKQKKKTSAMLETLKKGEGIKKDDEDTTKLKNTFDPDDHPKSTKSNKRRQRLSETGLDNPAFKQDESPPKRTPRKKITKKSQEIDDENDKTMSISELAPPSVTKKKKVKKKKVPEDEDVEEDKPAEQEEEAQEEEITPKKKKGKKKKKTTEEPQDEPQEEPAPRKEIADDGRVMGITIHRTDKLKTDFFIAHPLVKIHVVDMTTGKYLKKYNRNRPVISFYETMRQTDDGDCAVDYILPILTQPFDFKVKRSTIPVWEELVVLNENFQYFIQEDPRVILFFEILDFVSMNTARIKYNTAKQDGGWHRIAWGFLKLLGVNHKVNTDKKVRLQLFLPPFTFKGTPGLVDVYQWWKDLPRVNYPSTLYVTVKGIIPPNEVEPSMRSMFATQEERGKQTYEDLKKTLERSSKFANREQEKKGPNLWARLTGQACKIPNRVSLSLPAGRQGCFVVKFSKDGRYLACGCHDKASYPIMVYEIPSGALKGIIQGHYSIIYELCWSSDSKHLLSASSDGTARIWDCITFSRTAVKTIPHPSFVYTAQYHPRVNSVVVTGGYDKLIRVWSTTADGPQAQLVQEIEGHHGFINSLCFDEDGQKMYSADSLGTLRVWNVYVTERPSRKGVLRDWTLYKEVTDEEYRGVPINFMCMHPGGRRLLLHCRDNTLRMLDLRMFSVMQRYIGALNFREQLRSAISPCGTFVVGGSEDHTAYVWNTETGDQVAMYTELNYKSPVSGVDFHPYEHMMAFCSFGENHPVLVYIYDHEVAQMDAGFPGSGSQMITMSRPRSPEKTIKRPESPTKTMSGADLTLGASTSREDMSMLSSTARLERAKKKLDSVTAFQAPLRNRSPERPISRGAATTMDQSMLSSWGSTFDQTSLMGGKSLNTSAFSPHAPMNLSATMQQQQFAAHNKYMQTTQTGWRPQFGAVGRQGSVTPAYGGRPPQISLNATDQGKPQFSFQAAPTKSQLARQKQVVALYDYKAQRSDELSFARGDIITVLYKDSENWWMGELLDGQQGFFPVNYVAEKRSLDDSDEEDELVPKSSPRKNKEKDKKTTAVISKSGDLKFISETEDSDRDSARGTPRKNARQRRRDSFSDKTRRDSIDRLLNSVDLSSKKPPRKKKTAHFDESTA